MKNLKIGARLGLGFAAVLLLLLTVTAVAILRMGTAGEATNRLVNVSYKNAYMVNEWSKIIELNVMRSDALWKTTEPAEIQHLLEDIDKDAKRSVTLQATIESSLKNPEVISQFNKVKEQRVIYVKARDAMLEAKKANDSVTGGRIFQDQLVPASAGYLAAIQQLAKTQSSAVEAVATDLLNSYASTRTFLIVMGAIALAVGLGAGYLVTRSIITPLTVALHLAETVANGDLRSVIQVDRADEMGTLMQALQTMNNNLTQIVVSVRKGTDNIASASSEIAAGTLDLSARTEQQAGSLEETASSMEELTATVKQNLDHARQASTLASEASSIAEKGGTMVDEVIRTMAAIDEASKKIVNIISVIDGIAFQTNILALNAAVEAARAGEQGRGFAVVATEVRNLAQRSATAAKEIKLLIDDSVQRVEAGTALVHHTGGTMEEIVKSVASVTETIRQISEASAEQSAGIEQINQAVTEMDQVTQQNAALVEQAAAASSSMQEQAAVLAEMMSAFKTDLREDLTPAGPATMRSSQMNSTSRKPLLTALAVSKLPQPEKW